MSTKVTLLSYTQNPIQTIYAVWNASREEGNPIKNINSININDPEVISLFQKVVTSELPVSDMLNFVFLIENVSIALREQMVRHRVGIKFGDRLGADMIPELSHSSWWSQGLRVLDMSTFAQDKKYDVPSSILDNEEAYQVYMEALNACESHYKLLTDLGIPKEDARNVIPLGATHSITWSINLTALKHLIGKRSCWIPQLGVWEPVINGMVTELSTKIHPIFMHLVNPPCIENGQFKECLFKLDNEKRIRGEDEPTPCSLYIYHNNKQLYDSESEIKLTLGIKRYKRFLIMKEKFKNFWKRNPWTGENLEKQNKEEEQIEMHWNT